MMRNGTDKRAKKLAAIAVTVLVLVFLAVYAGTPLAVLFGFEVQREMPPILAPVLLIAAVITATAVGAVAALIQRMREIDKGEEDEAKKY